MNLSQAVRKTWRSFKTITIKGVNRRARYPCAKRTSSHRRPGTQTTIRPSSHSTSSNYNRWLKLQHSLAAQATCLRIKNWWKRRKSGRKSLGTMESRLGIKLNPFWSEKQRRAWRGTLTSLSLSLTFRWINSFPVRTNFRLQSLLKAVIAVWRRRRRVAGTRKQMVSRLWTNSCLTIRARPLLRSR